MSKSSRSERTSRRSSVNSAPITRTLIVNVDDLDTQVSNGVNKGLLDLEECVSGLCVGVKGGGGGEEGRRERERGREVDREGEREREREKKKEREREMSNLLSLPIGV